MNPAERRASPPERPSAVDDGEVGRLLHGFDWASVNLPSLADWPQSLRSVVDMMLHSPVPMVLLWGEDGVMIYNDAYSGFAGGRHPQLFGARVLEGWPEVADFNRRVMYEGLAGRTLSFRDQQLVLYRHGRGEDVWMDLDYSPVLDERRRPAGVLAIVLETTERVRLHERLQAERAEVASLNGRLQAERDGMRRLFQRAPGFMAVLNGPEHVFDMANEAYLTLVGHRDLYGKTVTEALPEVRGQGFVQLLDHVYGTGEPYVGHAASISLQRHAAAPAETRYVDFIYQPVRTDAGQVEGVFVQGHDVTERHLAFAALAESEQRFRLIADSAPSPMWVSEPGGRRQFVNKAYADFLGLPYEDALATDWRERLHPDDVARVQAEQIAGEASGKPFGLVARFRRADGRWRWLRSQSQPRWGPSGEPAGFVGLAFDVTDQMSAAEHQRLLIHELNHRVKNTLATVQSLAAQTFRAGVEPDEARRRFQARLQALSKAHDVLTRENWEGAALRDVVDQALRPYRDALSDDRVQASGPDLQLSPRAALALAMTLHELATNAAKYGALSNDAGRVALSWAKEGARDGEADLVLSWREQDGPPVAEPERRGFGSRLIQRQVSHELGGEAEFTFRPEGLVCTLRAPLQRKPSASAD